MRLFRIINYYHKIDATESNSPAPASSPNGITSSALVTSLEACRGIDLSPATAQPPLGSPRPPCPSPPLTSALLTPATATPHLRSRRPRPQRQRAEAKLHPSAAGSSSGFPPPCRAAAPRLATDSPAESQELAHAVCPSHAGGLALAALLQPRALLCVLPCLASAGCSAAARLLSSCIMIDMFSGGNV